MNVKFYTAANLSNELIEAQEYKKLMKIEKQLSKTDLLIIDELSYLVAADPKGPKVDGIACP